MPTDRDALHAQRQHWQATFEEALQIIRRCFTSQGPIDFAGKHFRDVPRSGVAVARGGTGVSGGETINGIASAPATSARRRLTVSIGSRPLMFGVTYDHPDVGGVGEGRAE